MPQIHIIPSFITNLPRFQFKAWRHSKLKLVEIPDLKGQILPPCDPLSTLYA